MHPTLSSESDRRPSAGGPHIARGATDWRGPISLTGLGGLAATFPNRTLRLAHGLRGGHGKETAAIPERNHEKHPRPEREARMKSSTPAPEETKRTEERGESRQIRPNPGKSNQIVPNPTLSHQIQVNPTSSNQIIPSRGSRGCSQISPWPRSALIRAIRGKTLGASPLLSASDQIQVNPTSSNRPAGRTVTGAATNAGASARSALICERDHHSLALVATGAGKADEPSALQVANPTVSHQIQVNPTKSRRIKVGSNLPGWPTEHAEDTEKRPRRSREEPRKTPKTRKGPR